ncbi:MAG: DNA methyltransferase, partial [Cyanobacteria bacterium P01_D01_bin.71]
MTSCLTFDSASLSNNKLQPSDRAFHDWYRFVLSYPPHLVRHYVNQFGLTDDATLLDPFCGTGTTIVEAKKNGLSSVGVEAVPMSHFACRTKVQWNVDLEALASALQQVSALAQPQMSAERLLKLTPEQQAIMVKNSICDRPLNQCLVLRNAIATVSHQPVRDLFNLALAYVAVHAASNLKFGPEVGIRRRKRLDAPV